ncbi:MAG: L-seryl-tRNA(Sec) selenium transferase [Candidatus Latescibacteria bacterium]|nr:L-seryl-tRNA(Sec) selenium transferase [Candidatus Latescibacterota bacterium]
MSELYKAIPPVDRVLDEEETAALLQRYRRDYIVGLVRQVLQEIRSDREQLGQYAARDQVVELVQRQVAAAVAADERASLKGVINATGIILHTGLGRAPMPAAAVAAVQEAAAAYCNLEFDLESGQRGSRISHIEALVCQAAGAQAATVVNNNAAAVLITLNTLAQGRQVIVSRGELVEIGGSFRVPDIIASSGAVIREVGTTNRTHLRDYEGAITDETALILVVHPSNYRIQGFTAQPELDQLAQLSRRAGLPLVFDMGGGVLEDLATWGLPHEPVVGASLAAGANLVTFSGDKVLGGPQAGLIAGGRDYIEDIARNPLMRTLRCDKMVLAALEACLRLYRLNADQLRTEHPVLRMMTAPLEDLDKRAKRILEALEEQARTLLDPQLAPSSAQAGSGTMPVEEIASRALVLTPPPGTAEELGRRLRLQQPPVVGRIQQEQLVLDMRTVQDSDVDILAAVLNSTAASWPRG